MYVAILLKRGVRTILGHYKNMTDLKVRYPGYLYMTIGRVIYVILS